MKIEEIIKRTQQLFNDCDEEVEHDFDFSMEVKDEALELLGEFLNWYKENN